MLAHELGHLKCDHGVWLTAANVLALGTVSLLPVVSTAVEEGLMRWLRAAELTCDRAALLVAQDRWVRCEGSGWVGGWGELAASGGSVSISGPLTVTITRAIHTGHCPPLLPSIIALYHMWLTLPCRLFATSSLSCLQQGCCICADEACRGQPLLCRGA